MKRESQRVCRYCAQVKPLTRFRLIARGKHRKRDKRRDRRCVDCIDAIPLAALVMIFGGLCALCGREASRPTIDHIKPISKGGKHEWSNVQLACLRCNVEKGGAYGDKA